MTLFPILTTLVGGMSSFELNFKAFVSTKVHFYYNRSDCHFLALSRSLKTTDCKLQPTFQLGYLSLCFYSTFLLLLFHKTSATFFSKWSHFVLVSADMSLTAEAER